MNISRPCLLVLFACYSLGLLFGTHTSMAQYNATIPVNIGVLLDISSATGRMTNSCIYMAISDFYSTHRNYSTRLVPYVRDSKNDVISAASAALDLLRNGQVHAIIGPETSEQSKFVADLGHKTQVPIISSTVTTPYFSNPTPYFVRTAANDSFQVGALVELINAFHWKKVVLIHEDTDYGIGIMLDLVHSLQESDIVVSNRSVIPQEATDNLIRNKLKKLMTELTRVFIVHMSFSLGSILFTKAEELGMMSTEYVWIITDGLASELDSMDPAVIASMQGVVGIKTYVPETEELKNFTARWILKLHVEYPEVERADLSISGLRTYDSVLGLAFAVERLQKTKFSFPEAQVIKNFKTLGHLISYSSGPQLLEEILELHFEGLSGELHLKGAQTEPPSYQIVNVIGKGSRAIGFWTPACGISRYLQLELKERNKCNSTSRSELEPIIWPGGHITPPKGWVLPTIMRVGIAVTNSGFPEFTIRHKDGIISGFCLDVFAIAVERLPFALAFELIPFDLRRSSTNEYDLINHVVLKNFDVVIGATAFELDQSSDVDYTASYTDLGVSMIVPVADERKKGWIFMKPFHTNLWLMTLAAFIFTGIVVWLLERRVNEEFRGSPSQQFGMIFWFAFSTAVYAHRERMASNLSKFVVIIWIFVVFVLTSSYTACLSSMLTIQQLTLPSINELINKGDYVGYRRGSVVRDLLLGLYFDPSKLRAYSSLQEYKEALHKGSRNGGVSAIVDEMPYINLFLGTFCDEYTSIGPIYNTNGFRFVGQKGSLLISMLSKAILELKEEGILKKLWTSWALRCEKNTTDTNLSNGLGLNSFQNLFVITFAVSVSALLHILLTTNPGNAILQHLKRICKNWYRKETTSQTTSSSDDISMEIELYEEQSTNEPDSTDHTTHTLNARETTESIEAE